MDNRPDALGCVVRVMRRIEARANDSGRRRAQMLEECRAVLRAKTVAVCHVRQNGELAVLSLAGAPPDRSTSEEIVARMARRPRDWVSVLRPSAESDLALSGRGSDVVVALLPPGAGCWVADFVGFIAERFLHLPRKPPPDELAESARGLVLPPGMIVGPSAAMRDLLGQMSVTVSSGLDVLLSGETGAGKELLARIVHASGPARGGPFIAVNCAAIPGELLEAELFGVERRVATGVDPRIGLFAEANGGSMFLDEIGELPERLQAKLLRVLQEREVLALGASRPRKIAVRIISASNRDLGALATEGRFRADLYYRLRGLEFEAPPLRNRIEDIPALATAFLSRAAEEYGKRIEGITIEALELLRTHAWPGNVRELQTEVRRAALLCPDGDSLRLEHLRFAPLRSAAPIAGDAPAMVDGPVVPLRERIEAAERAGIGDAMRVARGNRSLAARMLGITRNGLAQKLRRLGMEPA